MQQQLLTAVESEPRVRHRYLVVLAASVLALAACGQSGTRVAGQQPAVTEGTLSPPIPPDTEVMNSNEIVHPSLKPTEGEGTPILVKDALQQPLGIDGAIVSDLSKAPFTRETPTSLGKPSRLAAFSDFTAIAYVFDDTKYGPLIVKEGANADPVNIDAIVAAVDDPNTPERGGIDPSTGHEYVGVDTRYGTALIEIVNGYASILFNLDHGVYAKVTGVDRSLTKENAVAAAGTMTFAAEAS